MLKPINWETDDLPTQHERMREMLGEYENLFRGLCHEFIGELLKKALIKRDAGAGMTAIPFPELSTIAFQGNRDIKMMEPTFVNPNSYENVKVMLTITLTMNFLK